MKKYFLILVLFFGTRAFSQAPPTSGYLLTRSNGAVSIGTETNTSPLTVANFSTTFPSPQAGTIVHLVSDAVTNGRISFDTYQNTNFTGSNYQGRRARGTASSPTAALTDDILVAIGADGYGDDSFTGSSVGSMNIRASGTFTNTSKPTYVSFTTTPTGSITQVERLRIKPDGTVQITGLNAVGVIQSDGSGNLSTGNIGQSLVTNLVSDLSGKQATLVSGTNIKTVNGNTLLGSGDVSITSAVSWGSITGVLSAQTDLVSELALKANLISPVLVTPLLGTPVSGNFSTGTFTWPTFNQNTTGSAATLTTPRTINGTAFDGSANITLGNGSVTLAQMADMATGSLIGRNTVGTGVPEVLSASTAKTLLSLNNVTNESKATMFTNAVFTGTFTAPNSTITNAMLAGSISNANLANSTITIGSTSTSLGGTSATIAGLTLTAPVIGAATGTSLAATGAITSSGTAGVGYATGAGGTVTQATSKSTGVTLNKTSGQITMNGAALAAGAEVAFTLTNSTIAATDVIIVNVQSVGTAGSYLLTVGAVAAGSCSITVSNASAGSLSQAIVLNFVVIKGVTS